MAGSGSVRESLLQDGRFAIRAFVRRPLFTTVALLGTEMSVAALTTVFSLVKAVTFRPLPASHVERVVVVWQQDLTMNGDRITLSPLEFREYGQATSFESVAAMRGVPLSVGAGTSPAAVSVLQVSPELFTTLGITRVWCEASRPLAKSLVGTSAFWRTHLGADRGDREGVDAPRGFRALRLQRGSRRRPVHRRDTRRRRRAAGGHGPAMAIGLRRLAPLPEEPSGRGLVVFARLAPGATLASASAETATIARGLRAQFPERNRNVDSRIVTLGEEVVGDVTPTLVLLSAAVLLLGLIVCACANVGDMVLSR